MDFGPGLRELFKEVNKYWPRKVTSKGRSSASVDEDPYDHGSSGCSEDSPRDVMAEASDAQCDEDLRRALQQCLPDSAPSLASGLTDEFGKLSVSSPAPEGARAPSKPMSVEATPPDVVEISDSPVAAVRLKKRVLSEHDRSARLLRMQFLQYLGFILI